jgi:hypothetical protein
VWKKPEAVPPGTWRRPVTFSLKEEFQCVRFEHYTVLDLFFSPQVVAGLFAAAVIGSWCNLLSVTYIGT